MTMTLGKSITPSVVKTVKSDKVDINIIQSEKAIFEAISRYKTLENTNPTTMNDLITKGYLQSSLNNNGFGGVFTFSINATKGTVTISTDIADLEARNSFINSSKNTFKPVQGTGNTVNTTFILPLSMEETTGDFLTGIPISTTAPSAATNKYWYDTSGTTAILRISDGTNWKTLTTSNPNSSIGSVSSSVGALPTRGVSTGDVKYVYDSATNGIQQYAYYNGAWVASGSVASSSAKYIKIVNNTRYWSDNTYAVSCNKYINSGISSYIYSGAIGDGVYKIDPDGLGGMEPFNVYCDQTTDGGGWTLVWSNLRGNTTPLQENLTWSNATSFGPPIYAGTINSDKETFQVYTPLETWNAIGEKATMLLRYEWRINYGMTKNQEVKMTLQKFSSTDQYTLKLSNLIQLTGSIVPGFYSYHGVNNYKFSTFDIDNDTHPSTVCTSRYTNTPFWYGACWDGSFNGGGTSTGDGHYNGAYWDGSLRQWADATGNGAGNGWLWIK